MNSQINISKTCLANKFYVNDIFVQFLGTEKSELG